MVGFTGHLMATNLSDQVNRVEVLPGISDCCSCGCVSKYNEAFSVLYDKFSRELSS